MIDTFRIESPPLVDWHVDELRTYLNTKMQVINATGEVAYEFTSGELQTSADYRIRAEIREYVWEGGRDWRRGGIRLAPVKVEAPPFLVIEGSVHKAIMRHNVHGGPVDPRVALRWMVAKLADVLALDLPPADLWVPVRLDVAEIFNLGSFEACQDFISTMNQSKYPRRTTANFNGQSISFSGTMTYTKAYHKGPEFGRHDRRRLANHMHASQVEELQEFANKILRVEVEIKRKKFQADLGQITVADLTEAYISAVFDREVARIFHEGNDSMKIVRRNKDVAARLSSVYDGRLSSVLFGTWMQLAALGEDEVRRSMSRPTFYRQRKQLQDAGVSWFGSDVMIVESAIPEGFRFQRGSQWHVSGESYEVQKALLPHRVVA